MTTDSVLWLSKLLHIPLKINDSLVIGAAAGFYHCRLSSRFFGLSDYLLVSYRNFTGSICTHRHSSTVTVSCVGEAVLVKLNDKQAASQHLRSSQLGCLFYDNWYRINVIHSILTLIFRFYFQCQYAKKEQCKIKHLVMNMIHNLIFINIKQINLKDSLLPQW